MAKFSKNQLERYPVYLKYFKQLQAGGVEFISLPTIADKLDYSEEQVRKDLQAISSTPGVQKKGRRLDVVIKDIEAFLGYEKATNAALIGVGHLGGALLNYPAFKETGLSIVVAFEKDASKINKTINATPIFPISELKQMLKKYNAKIVIIAVPAQSAQEVVDEAIQSGAKGIWNFAPIHLVVPKDVVIENVNLASSLAVLSHRLSLLSIEERK